MKILITTGVYPPEIGGPATYTALMEKELPKVGIDVNIIPFRIVRKWPPFLRHLLFLVKVLFAGSKADLLYAQDPVSVGFPTMVAAKLLSKPFLVRIAGDYAWEQSVQRFGVKETIDDFQNKKYGFSVELLRFLQRNTASFADKVITPSKYFAKLVSNWNSSKIEARAIYNGIDFGDIAQSYGRYEPKTIISAGRLLPWKGFAEIIVMMKNIPEWKLFIAGDGPLERELLSIIKSNDLEKRVFLLGSMARNDLLKKIGECEVFVLNTSFESFSFQVVEAMRAKTPVVTTNIGNLAEIIDDGKEGILVEPNDTRAILNAVSKLQDQAFRANIVKNAFIKSESFSISNTVNKTAELIKSLIKN